jgi:alanyl-tRNA synthetase
MFTKYADQTKASGTKVIPAKNVWRLYDTYGFPLDLTRIMSEELGLDINEAEVEVEREKAREASKAEKRGAAGLVKLDVHDIGALDSRQDISKTDDSAKFQKGVIQSTIKAIYHKKFVTSTKEIPEGEQFGIILDKTNFYGKPHAVREVRRKLTKL